MTNSEKLAAAVQLLLLFIIGLLLVHGDQACAEPAFDKSFDQYGRYVPPLTSFTQYVADTNAAVRRNKGHLIMVPISEAQVQRWAADDGVAVTPDYRRSLRDAVSEALHVWSSIVFVAGLEEPRGDAPLNLNLAHEKAP